MATSSKIGTFQIVMNQGGTESGVKSLVIFLLCVFRRFVYSDSSGFVFCFFLNILGKISKSDLRSQFVSPER